MEEFLKDYIQMMAEAQEIKLDESTLQDIVNSIAANEVVWDVLDEHINYEFDDYPKNFLNILHKTQIFTNEFSNDKLNLVSTFDI